MQGHISGNNTDAWKKNNACSDITRNVHYKILGITFNRHHALSYNTLPDKSFWETAPIKSGNLLAQERIFIDALSSKNNKIKVHDRQQTRKLDSTTL
jgi:S-formylglutathione hydrolase FrmB